MPFDRPANSLPGGTLLPRHRTLVLDDAAGTVIAVDRGCLWVTLERDLRDIVLTQGMRFQVDRNGRTIVAAEEDSRLRLLRPGTRAGRGAARRLRDAVLHRLAFGLAAVALTALTVGLSVVLPAAAGAAQPAPAAAEISHAVVAVARHSLALWGL